MRQKNFCGSKNQAILKKKKKKNTVKRGRLKKHRKKEKNSVLTCCRLRERGPSRDWILWVVMLV